jgi:adenylate kinase
LTVKLIMLSPPGAGKGTHSTWLTAQTGIAHISSGDLLRAEIAQGTELGRRLAEYTRRGDLVPDDLVFDLLTPVVVEAARSTGGYLLDGFPRTMPQALRAAEIGVDLDISTDVVVYLTAPEAVLVERLIGRARQQGRADDSPDVIRHRLAVFAPETAPVVDYYRGRGVLLEVDADRPVDVIRADLEQQLTGRGLLAPAGPAPHRASSPGRSDDGADS